MENGSDLMVGGEVVLHGFVGDSFMDEGFTPKQVLRALSLAENGDVTIRLNSGGGYATDGAAIYAAIKSYRGKVTVRVEGIAASAASLIAMGGDEIVMAPGALMMIHDPAALTIGTASDHRKSADDLEKMADNYADAYAARSKRDPAIVRQLMLAETWMTGVEAVEMGFADRVDEDEETKAVAAFPYEAYARTPQELRAASQARGWAMPSQAAPAASTARKEISMSTKAEAAGQAVVEDKAVDVTAIASDAVAAERNRVVAIRKAVAKMKLDGDLADTLIEEGVSVEQANARIIDEAVTRMNAGKRDDAWVAKGDRHEYGARPAEPRGDRLDERETMRAGVEEAMLARMGVAEATDRARPFMDFRSLPAMAAAYMGDRRPLDSYHGRAEVLMAAFHTTSDFPALLENVMNKALVSRYSEAQPTYRRISRSVSFADFRPHPMVKMGDFPEMQEVTENGEIKFGTFGDAKETVLVKSYGVGVPLSRQTLVNDSLSGIQQVLADRGRAVARFEDKIFYAMMLSGANADGPALLETTRQVFNTTDKTKAGSGAAITVTSVSAGRAALRKRKSVGGDALLDVSAAIMLVGPDKETEAQQLVAPIQADQVGQVNPFSGSLQIVTTARIDGNAWYLFADPADVPCFVYGFLDGFEAPRVRIEEPFGQQGVALTVEHDFGCGAIDFRGGWKNPGN